MPIEHFDVLVVGAGLSGIGAGYHLQARCPGRSYAILEGRGAIGGTWDLFRYPGIRSDSDMYTLGYSFRPWKDPKAIADGQSILEYIRQTARDHRIDERIRFEHRVVGARWSSDEARWTVSVERGAARELVELSCGFLFVCAGYYDYAAGHDPGFPGKERFTGRIVHPQAWPDGIDYADKRVVVIGSGATAVTLVPELAKTAAHVTMLQRSPTYMISRPDQDHLANWLRERLPARVAYGLTRWKNVTLGMLFYQYCRRYPEKARSLLVGAVAARLGPDFDVGTHFSPSYQPWDQRLCLVPNADLFAALRSGRASVVTDHIETFTEKGIRLNSGAELDADVIVTATGLELLPLGGIALNVDGGDVELGKTFAYKGMMYSDVPNLAACTGYTNASWTLKCDLTCAYVCRVLNHMERREYRRCVPRVTDPNMERKPWANFTSGYVQRALHKFPSQGARAPWRLYQNYALDLLSLRLSPISDGGLEMAP